MTVYEVAASAAVQSRTAKIALRGHNLTLQQVQVLLCLEARGSASMGVLADAVGLSNGTFTAMVDVLERKGLVVRTRSTQDRRVVLIKMTPSGHAALNGLKLAAIDETEESA